MSNGLAGPAALQVARVFRDGTFVGISDRQILEQFVERHDEGAFEAILTRHGPMVRNVCRQILVDPHDVDDAFQAVFLVLVRKAHWLRIDESLGPWLFKVARRVAARARANRRKLWARESSRVEGCEPSYLTPTGGLEIARVMHDELGRLPERLRAPLVLCYLEGLTHDLAARQLDCPVGTVRSRLARGRSLLHRRITRRGFALSAAALGGLLESSARAAVASQLPMSLSAVVTRAMLETVQRPGIALNSSSATLLEGVLNVSRIKKIAVLASVISAGALAFAFTERSKVAGQTPEPQSRTDALKPDDRQLGPDGRPIGTRRATEAYSTYPRTYYVGDLILPAKQKEGPATGPATGEPPRVDMTPMMDLIEMAVAPGTWNIQDGYGHALPPKAHHHGSAQTNPPNAMVPFFLSVSLIIKGSREVHDDVANLLRCLRRLKNGETIETEDRITGPIPQRPAQRVDAKSPANSTAARRKRIDQLLDELREEVQKLEGSEAGSSKTSPGR